MPLFFNSLREANDKREYYKGMWRTLNVLFLIIRGLQLSSEARGISRREKIKTFFN